MHRVTRKQRREQARVEREPAEAAASRRRPGDADTATTPRARRHAALVRLSHDHHQALAQALWLRRSIVGDAVGVRRRFLDFWRSEAEPHFYREEQVLAPICWRQGGGLAALAERMLAEHAELRAEVRRLERDASADLELLHALGYRLQRHVRFEERVLFPLLEASLHAAELHEVGERLGA